MLQAVLMVFLKSCDECTDTSNREKLVICLRQVDKHLEVQEDFIGLYTIPDITANTI